MSNQNKIILTGASGFLGRHLLKRMKDDDRHDVLALSSCPETLRNEIGGSNVSYISRNALFDKKTGEAFKNAVVINCAFPRNLNGTDMADGLKYIQELFTAATENKAEAIINISSQSVYSQQRKGIATEETPLCLESPYAVGKYAVELMLESISRGTETHYTNLRMASLIGPGFNQRIVNRFAIWIMNNDPIKITREKRKFGFLDVEDAVNAIETLLKSDGKSWNCVYNVGNGKGYTIEELYNAVAYALKDKVEILSPTYEEGSNETTTAVSYERLHQDTGYVPEIDLSESIERIVDMIR